MRAMTVVCAVVASAPAFAQQGSTEYPARPVRIIVPYSPGGSSDTIARLLTQKLGENLGQTLVVDNRPGGSGTIGRDIVAKAVPDGYTLLVGDSPHTINVHVLRKVPYHPVDDFTPITLLAMTPQLMVVPPALPASGLKEFVALARSQPGKLLYGSGGSGSITHLTGELLKLAAGIDVTHVPYKSIAPAMTDVMGAQIQAAFPSLPGATTHVRSGRLRALAVSGARRSPAVPEVPTFVESGYPAVVVSNWFGVMGPARLPAAIVTRLHAEVLKAVRSAEVQEKFVALSLETSTNSPAEFRAMLGAEIEKWGKVVKQAGIQPE